MNKKAQSEMIGFAIIVLMVAILIIIFFALSLNERDEEENSKESEHFLNAMLEYTTPCAKYSASSPMSIQNLIGFCEKEGKCLDERNSCQVLGKEIKEILETAFPIGEDYETKGYVFIIISRGEVRLRIPEGEQIGDFKSAVQNFGGEDIQISFQRYY